MIAWRASDGPGDDPIISALCQSYDNRSVPVDIGWINYQRIAGTDNWYVAACDWQENWWGSFDIFRWDGEQITPAAFTGEFTVNGQSIHEIGSLTLTGFTGSIVRVVDTTHQGNRTLLLFELNPETGIAHCLLSARTALNFNWDRYNLALTFDDIDGDGHVDAILAGVLTQLPRQNEMGDPVGQTTLVPVRKVYLWNGYDRQFELSMIYSEGVGPWDDMDTGYVEIIP